MVTEVTTVEGRPAIITYLNDRFEPVGPDDAIMVKVTFTDDLGGIMFATLARDESPAT